MRKIYLLVIMSALSLTGAAQGTWAALRDTAPGLNNGVMLLLTNGNIITTITDDPLAVWDDSCGPAWNKLIPDSTGSYLNGHWAPMASMQNSRIYFSSWVLPNGKVYVAGGEFGTGGSMAELYDPVADTWSPIPGLPTGYRIEDANSQMLPDGRILQNSAYSEFQGLWLNNYIYDAASNSFSEGPQCFYTDDEATWVKLPDNSILYEVTGTTQSQRFIPALNRWIADADLPVNLYDNFGGETGAGIVLPDGRALFLGSNGNTAIYTPTGDTTLGSWTAGPVIPNHMGTPDAAAAMLPNGKVLCAVAPVPTGPQLDSLFQPYMYFYLYDYTTDSFTQIPAPGGGWVINQPSCSGIMLNLPDGTVLFGVEGSNQYYIYTPDGAPLASGKPTIDAIVEKEMLEFEANGCPYMITGTLFNGISQGSAYGDDWQMATNYPVIRLIANGQTWFAPTYNWNRTGIQTGNLPDTAYFIVPANIQGGPHFELVLSANGISSDTFNFMADPGCGEGIAPLSKTALEISPNPSTGAFVVQLPVNVSNTSAEVYNTLGQKVWQQTLSTSQNTLNLSTQATGVYFVQIQTETGVVSGKVMVVR